MTAATTARGTARRRPAGSTGGAALRRATRLLDLDAGRFALAALLGSLGLASGVGLSATAAWLIARAAQMPPVLDLTVATVAVRMFGISKAVLRYAERLVSHEVALRGMGSLREQVYTRLAEGRLDAVAGVRRGDLLARTGADVDAVGDVVVRAYLPMVVAAVVGLATVALQTAILPAAGLVLAACLALTALVGTALTARATAAAQRDHVVAQAALTDAALIMLDGAGELAVSGRRSRAVDALRALEGRIARAADRRARPLAVAQATDTLALVLAVLGAIALGVPATVAGTLDPVHLSVVVLTPLAAFEGTQQLGGAASHLVRARAAAGRIMALLDAPAAPGTWDRAGTDPPAAAGARAEAPAGSGVLRAEGLAVGWPAGPTVLTGLDLEARPGRALALVGPSGVGKTTLLFTLAGLLPPRAGRVTLDGVDLADLDRQALTGEVTLTPEDAHLFATTVLENLRVADGHVTAEDATAALRRAGLGDWVDALPDGLDTMLAAEAATISGGERRRLLLARALVGRAGLLLLDEPAEHLDPATADALVTDLLRGGHAPDVAGDPGVTTRPDPVVAHEGPAPATRRRRARGTVLATHRLSALDSADEVLVLEPGAGGAPATVRARGTHAHLAATDPAYAWSLAQENEGPRSGADPEGHTP